MLVEVEVEVEVAEEVLLLALPAPRPEQQVPSIFDGMVGLIGCRGMSWRRVQLVWEVQGKEFYAAKRRKENLYSRPRRNVHAASAWPGCTKKNGEILSR